MRILLAEDGLDLSEALKVYLEKNKFNVETVSNGLDALDYVEAMNFDAIILDIMMPKMDGLTLLKELRNKGVSTPIILLTAKTLVKDKVLGLDLGADDYIPKPFHPDELLSRLKAILRRGNEYTPTIITYKDLMLNTNNGELKCNKTNKTTRLSGKEFQIFELLLKYPSQTFSAEKIIDRCWEYETDTDVNSIWVHLSNIRKKLKTIGSKLDIVSLRSLGYTLKYNEK